MPPAALRSGDFSQAFNPDGILQIIYDPTTGNADGTGRTPFPGNLIPDESDRATSRRRSRRCTRRRTCRVELSNGNVGGAAIYRNYVRQQTASSTATTTTSRSNYNPSSQAQVWGKYSRMGANVDLAAGATSATTARSPATPRSTMYTFGTTWTLNPTTVFDATLRHLEDDPRVAGERSRPRATSGSTTLGIPGMNGGANFSSDPRYAGMPVVPHGGCWCNFDIVGNNDGWDPVERDERTYALRRAT